MDYLLIGEEHHRRGDLPRAIRAFQNALLWQPDHFWARYFLSVCYLRSQPARADLARDGLTACLGQEGRNNVENLEWIYLMRGVAHGELELFQEALEDFQKALLLQQQQQQGRRPNDDLLYAVHVNRGVLFNRQKKYSEAIADLKRAIDLKPQAYQAFANLANVHHQKKELSAAVEQMDKAIRLASSDRQALAHLYRNRARLQMDRQGPGSAAAALEDLRQAIQLGPSRPEDHVQCGRIFLALGRAAEALKAYEEALKTDSGHAEALLGQAKVYFKLEDYKRAILSLDHYLQRPNLPAGARALADVYRVRGVANMKQGQPATAIADFTLALSCEANSSATYSYRGWAYLASKAAEPALLDFEKAIQLDNDNSDAYNGRGAARLKMGRLKEAIADAEQALSRGGGPSSRTDPQELWNAARIYAGAANKLRVERNAQALKISTQYQERVIALLRKALAATPATKRSAFWRKYIQGDGDLSPFARSLRPR
jgi:tetratricopeptide (TPR) repeat protein